jgi:creatinine amidohydrolase/Fe(II)-dependent formamide hydrolase-like protein
MGRRHEQLQIERELYAGVRNRWSAAAVHFAAPMLRFGGVWGQIRDRRRFAGPTEARIVLHLTPILQAGRAVDAVNR